jgi:hypothetical protein
MKKHLPLPIPSDSAWDRPSWRKYTPIWIKEIIDGISNIIKWIPIIYKDRDWDDSYIFEMLKFKLIQQRKELVGANRHTGIEDTNRYITICLNLIEHIQEETYSLEYQDFVRERTWFSKNEGSAANSVGVSYSYNYEIEDENFSGYFLKYSNQVVKLLNKSPELRLPENKMILALELGMLNQSRCQKLLFKILNEKINTWWD